MKTTEIKCDSCGGDLTYTGNCEDWRLVLTYEAKLPWYSREGLRGGAVTGMAIPPPVNRSYHFCGLSCMDKWRESEHAKAARRKRWYDENSEQIAPNVRRCPAGACPSDDELEKLYS